MEKHRLRDASAQKDRWHAIVLPSLLGALLNILGFGFKYGPGSHIYELAMINWLRDPTLYPRDAIRESYARFPSVFWRAVALAPNQITMEAVLFAVFLATKIIFFYGLVRLARCLNPERYFVYGVTVLFALSPIFNIRTPFGYCPILDPVQTQTPLAVALLVYAGSKLAEGNWLRSAIVTAACFYLNAIYVVFMLFPFGALAITDFRHNKKQILWSAVFGALIMAPWILRNRALAVAKYPSEYLHALLIFYPRHLMLSTHNRIDFLYGPTFLCVALVGVIAAHKKGVAINWRVELMAAFFAIPVVLGVSAGQFHLTPLVASLQFMRADAFLFLYSGLLLAASLYKLAGRVALPLKGVLVLIAFAFVLPIIPLRFLLLLVGLTIVYRNFCPEVIDSVRVWLRTHLNVGESTEWLLDAMLLVAGLLIVWAAASATAADAQTWRTFELPPGRGDSFDLQTWARLNTPKDSMFLVPPGEGGFRIYSLRSSWGEWKDGMAVYLDPKFASTYVNRMNELGVYEAPMKPSGPDSMPEIYRRQGLERLLSIARENRLQYIVQYSDVTYDATPVYSNRRFRVYAVRP